VQDFRKLTVWQMAHGLTLALYAASANFPPTERFGLTTQVRRAASAAQACRGRPADRASTPCDVSEQYAVNVLDFRDLKSAVLASLPLLGEYPCQRGCCFKAGIVERSQLFGALCQRRA
jgi:hypothetical protein